MKNDSGYIKLYRSITNNYLWKQKPFDMARAWIDLILRASFKDHKEMIGNKIVEIKRGSFHTTVSDLSKDWGWGWDKTNSFLEILENDHMISRIKSRKSGTVITIEKYAFFQDMQENSRIITGNEPEMNRKTTGNEPEMNRNLLLYGIKDNKGQEGEEGENKKTPAPAESQQNNPRSIKGQTNKKGKKTHGALGNVKLLDSEVKALREKFPDDWETRIDNLSYYMGSTGKTYKSHYLTILNWARKDQQGQIAPESAKWDKAKAKAGIARPEKSEEEEKMWTKKMLERSRGRSLRGGGKKEKGEEK